MAGTGRSRAFNATLENWNPMDDDYNSPIFNSYRQPAPTELVKDFHGHGRPRVPELQLYVTGIPIDLDVDGLRNLFNSAGTVTRAKIGQPRNPGYSRSTFGFVTMSSAKEVDEAIKQLNDYQILENQRLRVSIADPNRQSRPSLPYQKAKRGEERGSGPYYRNINREDLHCPDDDSREIESSSGNIKVHLRRSNSQEDDTGPSGSPRKPTPRNEGYAALGPRKPATGKSVEGIITTQGEQMAMLLGMQQQAIIDLMSSRINLPSATNLSSFMNPLALLAPPITTLGTTASLEDITTPPKVNKPSKDTKIVNGEDGESAKDTPANDSRDDANRTGKDAAEMLPEIGDKKVTSSSQSEPQSHKAEVRICLKCGKHGKKKCSICHSPYCSAKCQQEDWPKHSQVCQKLKEEEAEARKEAPTKDAPSIPYGGSEYLSKDIKASRPCRKEMEVTATYLESPAAFWVQVVSNENINGYNALTALMEETFNDKRILFQPVIPQVDHVYACLREDDSCWYRSVVRSISGGQISVHFADFGDEATVSASNLRLINKDMAQLPFLSFKCCLKGVRPTGGRWTERASEQFQSLVVDKLLRVNFSQPQPLDQIFYISKMVDQQGVDVIKDLIESGFAERQAKPSISQPPRSPQDQPSGPAQRVSPAHDGKPSRTTPDTTHHQAGEKAGLVSPKPTHSPYSALPTKKSPTGSSSSQQGKTPSPQLGKSPPAQHGKMPAAQRGPALPTPVWKTLKVKDRIQVEISAIKSEGQLLYAYPAESAAAMLEMQEQLQICYGDSKKNPAQRYQTGDIIASVFSDQLWYRARVLDASTMAVFFIDYGGEMENDLDKCRALKPELTRLAPQCLNLSLDGVSAKDVDPKLIENWVTSNQDCLAEIVKIVDGILHVRLLRAGGSGESLNDDLIAKGVPPPDTRPTTSESPKRKAGECLDVAIVEVTGMSEIWACLVSDEDKLNALDKQLQEDYKSSRPGYSPKVGSVCVAMFQGLWYRAVVKAKLQENQFKVFFIDYGNSSEARTDTCRALLPKYSEIPPFAIRLHLDNAREEEEQEVYSQAFVKWCQNVGSVAVRITAVLKDRYLTRIHKAGDESDCFNDILGDVPPHPPVPVCPVVESVAVGDVMNLNITAKQTDPYLFYAVPMSQGEAIQELTKRLTEACQKQAIQGRFSPVVGEVCCSKFQGEEFYRAMVREVAGDKVNLLFIDFGNVDAVALEECCPLPTEFADTPMHAVRCRLDAVAEMPIEKVDLFQNTMDLCQLRVTRKDGDILVGVLWQGDKETDCLNSLPSYEGLGSGLQVQGAESGTEGGATLPGQPKATPQREPSVSPKGNEPSPHRRDASHVGAAPKRQTNPAKSGKTVPGAAPQQKPLGNPRAGGQQTSRPFIKASSLPSRSQPMIGKLLPVSLTHLETPAEMYFHLYVMETLETLNATLKDEEFQKLKDTLKEHHPQVGELCMAFVTDQWCRAEVLRVTGQTYTLSILDYGCSVELQSDKIRPVLPSFLQRKLACVKCSLFGILPFGRKSWPKEAISFARDTLESQKSVVQIKVMDVIDSVLLVEVYIPSETNGRPTSLAEQLISKGYAKEKINTTGPVVTVPHPLDNMELNVLLHGVTSPRDFYCQIIDAESIKQMKVLGTDIAEHVEKQQPNPDFKPAISEYCLAQFTEDNVWYRARVVKVEEGGRFKVQFIDFGNYDTVSQDHLLAMPPSFAELCALAIPCCLSGFDDSNIDAGQLEKLSKVFVEMAASMEIPYKARVDGTKDFVTQVSISADTGKNIGQELLTMLSNFSDETPTRGIPETGAPETTEEPVMSEIEKLRAELAAKELENQRLKQMLGK